MPTQIYNSRVGNEVFVPIGIKNTRDDIFIVLFKTERTYLREPFFIESLEKQGVISRESIKLPAEDELLARPVHYNEKDKRIVYKPLKEFVKGHNKLLVSKELAFIFHISRCGSTLTAQMLASNDRFFVFSEPTIINSILDPALKIDLDERKALIKASINSLIDTVPLEVEKVFIKFRSWNSLYMSLVLSVFPDTKWLFLHRNGVEVLSSVLEKPPGWLRSRQGYSNYFAEFLDLDSDVIKTLPEDEFVARILGAFCKIAKSVNSGNGLFLDYENLKKDFFNIINKLWHIGLSENEKEIMIKTSKLYSKDIEKNKEFLSDSEVKRNKATERQRKVFEEFFESERVKLINK